MDLKVNKIESIKGTIQVPGDKSISHRALLLASLAEGDSYISGFLPAEDCLSTLTCLQNLGVRVDVLRPDRLVVHGRGFHGFEEPSDVLDVGNSGTTLRMLPGLLAAQPFLSILTGDASVRQRPMGRITDPLREMGAKIWGRDSGTRAPLAVLGRRLTGIKWISQVASAQVKSAVLIAGLLAQGTTEITEPAQSRDHTERMLQLLGAEVKREPSGVSIKGGQELAPGQLHVPGDLSSAAFFIVAASIVPNSELVIPNVGINGTRTGVLECLKDMGAGFQVENASNRSNEPRADLIVDTGRLAAITIEGNQVPRLIDELPVIAVAATQAEGRTIVRGARELRVKETDRITAMARELPKMGARVEEMEDGWTIQGPTALKGAVVESYGDHRVAMALAIAGLVAEGQTVVRNADCIGISFPGFEEALKWVSQ